MAKIGRNMPCPCGSGKKYKKCCLSNSLALGQEERASGLAFVQKFKEQHTDQTITCAQGEDVGAIKISEVIVEFADELLSLAHTKKSQQRAIMLAIFAWNLALIEEGERESKIQAFLEDMKLEKNSVEWHDSVEMLEALICKKEIEYGSIDRLILDCEFAETRNGSQLNIISTEA